MSPAEGVTDWIMGTVVPSSSAIRLLYSLFSRPRQFFSD